MQINKKQAPNVRLGLMFRYLPLVFVASCWPDRVRLAFILFNGLEI